MVESHKRHFWRWWNDGSYPRAAKGNSPNREGNIRDLRSELPCFARSLQGHLQIKSAANQINCLIGISCTSMVVCVGIDQLIRHVKSNVSTNVSIHHWNIYCVFFKKKSKVPVKPIQTHTHHASEWLIVATVINPWITISLWALQVGIVNCLLTHQASTCLKPTYRCQPISSNLRAARISAKSDGSQILSKVISLRHF